MNFKKTFITHYGNALGNYGYKYAKKINTFIKFDNPELFRFITYRAEKPVKKGERTFQIFSGILSLYCHNINEIIIKNNSVGMKYFGLYYHNIPFSDDKLYKYNYNDENLLETINSSLYDTKKFIIPVIDSITNLEDYIKHQKTMRDISIFGNGEFFYNDSLALIAANNHESFLDLFEVWDEYLKQMFNENKMGGDYEDIRKLYYEGITAIPTSRDKVYNDPELYKKAIAEIKTRKTENTKTLCHLIDRESI